ncbi:lamin tail domain-containing protein [Actinorugispora endophytica]|nr:lamin tail domain-containing protein [Actinorugispora endophytica]
MRARTLAAALVAALTAALCLAAPAEAAPALQFTYARYDSPGTDTGSNKSVNGEYVTIRNTTNRTVNLRGYVLHDAPSAANRSKGRKWNYAYTFGSYSLAAGKSVTVYTGTGSAGSTSRYWGYKRYVWNNDGDTATLRSPGGSVVDSCVWRSKGSGSTRC